MRLPGPFLGKILSYLLMLAADRFALVYHELGEYTMGGKAVPGCRDAASMPPTPPRVSLEVGNDFLSKLIELLMVVSNQGK